MTSRELNLKLLAAFPEIEDAYTAETSWQDKDETGSHIVYADVFVPFIKAQTADNAEPFDFIEELLGLNDEYADEVAALSVIESLLCDEDFDTSRLMRHAKPRTLHLIEELQKS